MNILSLLFRQIKWYHVVGLLLGFTAIIGVIWWLREQERTESLRFTDETDLIEVAKN